jgi:hypothetical protein
LLNSIQGATIAQSGNFAPKSKEVPMLSNAALTHQSPIRRGARRTLPALVLALAAFLLYARPSLADDKSADQSLVKVWRSILGPVEVHLVFTDSNDKQQDYSLAEAPPDFVKMLPLALQNESKFPLLNPKVRYFDGLWLANGTKVCNEVVAGLKQTYPAGSNNTSIRTYHRISRNTIARARWSSRPARQLTKLPVTTLRM